MPESPAGARPLLKNLLLSLGSLLVFLVLAETLASIMSGGGERPPAGVQDPVVGFRLRSHHTYTEVGGAIVRTNSRGFRDEEVPGKRPPDGLRVLAVGDSSTFGYGVTREETWVERLERSLEARFPDRVVEVINAGTPGWSSGNGAAFVAGEGLAWKPDLVLVSFGYNEQLGSGPNSPHYDYDPAERRVLFHPLGSALRSAVQPEDPAGGVRSPERFFDRFRDFPRRLKLYGAMEWTLHALRLSLGRPIGWLKSSELASGILRRVYQRDPERIYGPLRVPVQGNHVLESYAAHLDEIARACSEAGVPLVFMLQPRRAYRELIDLLPDADRKSNLESVRLMRDGKPEQAIERLAPRQAARPHDAITAYHLAVAYQIAGRPEEARPLFEQVLPIRTFTMNALMALTAGRLGIPMIAGTLPLAESERRDLFFPDRYHLTAEGYALMAGDLERFLLKNGFLDRRPEAGGSGG